MKREVKLEQFFTRHDLAKECIEKLDLLYPIKNFSIVIEPSAGGGSFSLQIPHKNVVALDIDPCHPSVIKKDFFTYHTNETNTLVIGNPPFGVRGSLAAKFINRSANFAKVIAFILPQAFMRKALFNLINPYFHKVYAKECNAFVTPQGESKKINCVFMILEKRDYVRQAESKADRTHSDFLIKHYHMSKIYHDPMMLQRIKDTYDFAIPQVGKYCVRNVSEIEKGSYWFIKQLNPNVNLREIFEKMSSCFLSHQSTSIPSRRIDELIYAYKLTIAK